MKKTRYIVFVIIFLVAIGGGCMVISIMQSPTYALKQIIADVKESGLDGLKPHLTDEAQEVLDKIDSASENAIFNTVMTFVDKGNYISVLRTQIQKIQWDVVDVLKNREKANVCLSFDYEDKLVGTIEVIMLREDGDWKIDGFDFPKFEKIEW